MLGKYVRINVVNAIGTQDENGFSYPLNYGRIEHNAQGQTAYIMGIHHPVRNFDGRVIGVLTQPDAGRVIWIAAPKSTRFIVNDIREYIDLDGVFKGWRLECLYESSCGAVIYRQFNGETRYLLIKNKRSAHWGFPKGHIEAGESQKDTALREVLEETGLKIQIIDGFTSKSDYKIQGKIEKHVTIFIAKALSGHIKLQEEEIDDYLWQTYEGACQQLRFENDKTILKDAHNFLVQHQLLPEGE